MSKISKLCGPVFIAAGVNHFIMPKPYKAIMPEYLPAHDFLVQASGVAEAAGGLGLMIPATRQRAGKFLLLTLLAIFPANIEMARHPERFPQVPGGATALKARLPFQFVFAAWVLSAMRQGETAQ